MEVEPVLLQVVSFKLEGESLCSQRLVEGSKQAECFIGEDRQGLCCVAIRRAEALKTHASLLKG